MNLIFLGKGKKAILDVHAPRLERNARVPLQAMDRETGRYWSALRDGTIRPSDEREDDFCGSYLRDDGSLVIRFPLLGIREDRVAIRFRGDNLILSVKDVGDAGWETETKGDPGRSRELKYPVPKDEYAHELASAMVENDILIVSIPARTTDGIAVAIVKSGV